MAGLGGIVPILGLGGLAQGYGPTNSLFMDAHAHAYPQQQYPGGSQAPASSLGSAMQTTTPGASATTAPTRPPVAGLPVASMPVPGVRAPAIAVQSAYNHYPVDPSSFGDLMNGLTSDINYGLDPRIVALVRRNPSVAGNSPVQTVGPNTGARYPTNDLVFRPNQPGSSRQVVPLAGRYPNGATGSAVPASAFGRGGVYGSVWTQPAGGGVASGSKAPVPSFPDAASAYRFFNALNLLANGSRMQPPPAISPSRRGAVVQTPPVNRALAPCSTVVPNAGDVKGTDLYRDEMANGGYSPQNRHTFGVPGRLQTTVRFNNGMIGMYGPAETGGRRIGSLYREGHNTTDSPYGMPQMGRNLAVQNMFAPPPLSPLDQVTQWSQNFAPATNAPNIIGNVARAGVGQINSMNRIANDAVSNGVAAGGNILNAELQGITGHGKAARQAINAAVPQARAAVKSGSSFIGNMTGLPLLNSLLQSNDPVYDATTYAKQHPYDVAAMVGGAALGHAVGVYGPVDAPVPLETDAVAPGEPRDAGKPASARAANQSPSGGGAAGSRQESPQLVHYTSPTAAQSINSEGKLASHGWEIYALDNRPRSTAGKFVATFGRTGQAEIPIPGELNQYFKPPSAIGLVGLIRRALGVRTASPGVFDLNDGTFTPNVRRAGPDCYRPMTRREIIMAKGHRGLMDYGIDGLAYAVPTAVTAAAAARSIMNNDHRDSGAAPPVLPNTYRR